MKSLGCVILTLGRKIHNNHTIMTDEQITMLRRLIQDEIEVAGVDGFEHGVWGYMDKQLDKQWKEFQESFND